MAKRTVKKEAVAVMNEIQSVTVMGENSAVTVETSSIEICDKAETVLEGTDKDAQPAELVKCDAGKEEYEQFNFQEDIQANNKPRAEETKNGEVIFRSTSEELRYIIRDIVEDGEVYSKKVLVRILNEKASTGFTDACLINVLRNMVTDGSLMQVERGSYMKGNGSFKSRLHKYLSATRSGLKKACTLNASEMEEADFEIIKQIKAVECDLDILMETLEKLGA